MLKRSILCGLTAAMLLDSVRLPTPQSALRRSARRPIKARPSPPSIGYAVRIAAPISRTTLEGSSSTPICGVGHRRPARIAIMCAARAAVGHSYVR